MSPRSGNSVHIPLGAIRKADESRDLLSSMPNSARKDVPHIPIFRPVKGSLLALFLLVALAGCRPHDFPQYPANYREYAYVTNGGSGTVSIYDVVNVRLDRELAVGPNPVSVAASPNRNEVYVVNSGLAGSQGSVSVINAENNTVAATIPVHRRAGALALDPDGALAYVANSASNSVSVLDFKARREVAVIGTGEQPAALRVRPMAKPSLLPTARETRSVWSTRVSRKVRAVF